MSTFESSRVSVEFRDHVTLASPIYNRTYTITHSDDTGELFVTIGKDYAYDKVEELRDEVLVKIKQIDGQLMFYGTVLINDEGEDRNLEIRNEIFLRELPLAMEALKEADRAFFEQHPMTLDLPVCVWFQSTEEKYNKFYNFGTLRDMKKDSNR